MTNGCTPVAIGSARRLVEGRRPGAVVGCIYCGVSYIRTPAPCHAGDECVVCRYGRIPETRGELIMRLLASGCCERATQS